MRSNIEVLLMSLLIVCSSGCSLASKTESEFANACLNGGIARINIFVTDDEGVPVNDAKVRVLMGMNFAENTYMLRGQTKEDGRCLIEGITTGNEVVIDVDKEGWYGSSKKLCFIRMGAAYSVKDGKWQPDMMDIPLVIRKIRNPCQLIAKRTYHQMSLKDVWVGFDLEKNDWVSPHGKGRIADLEARLTWDGLPAYDTKLTRLDVRFPGEMSGCYEFTNIRGCAFAGAYSADSRREFKKGFSCSSGRDERGVWFDGVGGNNSLIVRSRVRRDENGTLLSANYSTIKAMSIEGGCNDRAEVMLRYYFNPRPNDTNLEPRR